VNHRRGEWFVAATPVNYTQYFGSTSIQKEFGSFFTAIGGRNLYSNFPGAPYSRDFVTVGGATKFQEFIPIADGNRHQAIVTVDRIELSCVLRSPFTRNASNITGRAAVSRRETAARLPIARCSQGGLIPDNGHFEKSLARDVVLWLRCQRQTCTYQPLKVFGRSRGALRRSVESRTSAAAGSRARYFRQAGYRYLVVLLPTATSN
jgi:hypothetical protein